MKKIVIGIGIWMVMFSVLPLQVDAQPTRISGEDAPWWISIDEKGESERLVFTGVDFLKVGTKSWRWFVKYDPPSSHPDPGELHLHWLTTEHIPYPTIDNPIIGKVWNNHYYAIISTWFEPYDYTGEYIMRQRLEFRAWRGRILRNFKFYQYLDADIGGRAGRYTDRAGIDIYAGQYGLDVPFSTLVQWDRSGGGRGIAVACATYGPWGQPDHYYYKMGWLSNQGYDVGSPSDILERINNDTLACRTEYPSTGFSDVAGALRWSKRYYDNGQLTSITLTDTDPFTVDIKVAVVPEPCTMLLMGSGLAGLAGIARRRRRQQ
jgi:hypothetical protein